MQIDPRGARFSAALSAVVLGLVLGPQGQVTRRASGLPTRPDVDAALALAAAGQGR